MAKAEVIELLKTFISILRAEGIDIDRAYLYVVISREQPQRIVILIFLS